jgi:hypothetical protein
MQRIVEATAKLAELCDSLNVRPENVSILPHPGGPTHMMVQVDRDTIERLSGLADATEVLRGRRNPNGARVWSATVEGVHFGYVELPAQAAS